MVEPTSIRVDYPPPPTADVGDRLPFDGGLQDQFNAGVPGRTVWLVIDGVPSVQQVTGSAGQFTFRFVLSEGVHTTYVLFEGDATYEGCSSQDYVTDVSPVPTPPSPSWLKPLAIGASICLVGIVAYKLLS